MKRLLLLLLLLIGQKTVIGPMSLLANVTPPTEHCTTVQYSMGAYLCPQGESENWDAGFFTTVVYSDDGGEVWINNLFPQYYIDRKKQPIKQDTYYEAWVQGTIANGRIRIEQQTVLSRERLGLVAQVNHAEQQTVEMRDYVELIIAPDGTLYMEDYLHDSVIVDDDNYVPTVAACLVDVDTQGNPVLQEGRPTVRDYAMGYKLVPLSKEQYSYPKIPQGLSMEQFTWDYTTWMGKTGERTIKLGIQDNEVYIAGLCPLQNSLGRATYPDLVLHGTLSDDGKTITLPNEQYCGLDNYYGVAYLTWMYGMEYNWSLQWYEPIVQGVCWKYQGNGRWEMTEDTNIIYMSPEGNPLEIVALSTLQGQSPETIEAIEVSPTSPMTYSLSGQRGSLSTPGIMITSHGQKYICY